MDLPHSPSEVKARSENFCSEQPGQSDGLFQIGNLIALGKDLISAPRKRVPLFVIIH